MRIAIFVLVLMGFVMPAHAELIWRSAGPGGGGAFESAAISTEGVVFVGSDLSGAYLSADGGWTWRGLGSANGLQSTHVDGVAVDPDLLGTVLLGADNGLYVSDDCGKAADALCSFRRKFEAQVTMAQFASRGVAYAAGVAAYCKQGALLWRSLDHGKSWQKTSAIGLPQQVNVMALRAQAGKPEHLIAISAPERFTGPETCGANWPDKVPCAAFESMDGGEHFTRLDLAGDIEDVKFDLVETSKLWITLRPPRDDVSANGAVYERGGDAQPNLVASDQTGQIWPLSHGGIRLLDLRRQRPWNGEHGFWQWDAEHRKFVPSTSAEDYVHWDMGWSSTLHAPQASLNGHLQSFVPVNDDEAWWVDDQFVHRVTGGGRLVENVASKDLGGGIFATRGIDNAVAGVLAPSPADPDILYAGYFDLGCFRTEAAQAAQVGWRSCNGPPAVLQSDGKYENSALNGWWHGFGGNVTAIALDPEQANVVWAVHSPHSFEKGSAASGFYKVVRSADGIASFENVTFNLTSLSQAAAIVALAVDAPAVGHRRLWAIAGGRLYKLDHATKSWVQVRTGCDGGLLVLAQQGAMKLAGGTSGVCLSHDNGATWHVVKTSESMGAPRAVWWGPFDGTPRGVSDIAFDSTNPSRVWMTVLLPTADKNEARAGLYRSDDGGENWRQVDSFGAAANKQRNFARTVAVNPLDPNMIVVGTSVASVAGGYLPEVPMGAFISRDGGKTWHQENRGLNWPFITQLRFVGHKLYGLSPGQGVVYSDVK